VVWSISEVSEANLEPRAERVLIVLADISGYTGFMLANRLMLVHGQQLITSLIEALIAEVEIPLELQEIEGDALFLFARDPGGDTGWRDTCREVAHKLPRFFETFAARLVRERESTLCKCGSCQNADRLKLKVIAHSGEALFHKIDRYENVSGVDVILAHRLLKNSVEGDEYLLVTDAARSDLPFPDSLAFVAGKESYDGFGEIAIWVHRVSDPRPVARDRQFDGSTASVIVRTVNRNLGAVFGQFPALLQSGELAKRHDRPASRLGQWAMGFGLVLILPLELLFVLVSSPFHILRRRRRAQQAG
jgi:hypothetical protein